MKAGFFVLLMKYLFVCSYIVIFLDISICEVYVLYGVLFRFFDYQMTLQQQLMEDILRYWQENKIFEQSVLSRAANMSYMFYDGPPFPSGDPHYGHLLQSTVKDLVPRWMTMRGYRVQRRR